MPSDKKLRFIRSDAAAEGVSTETKWKAPSGSSTSHLDLRRWPRSTAFRGEIFSSPISASNESSSSKTERKNPASRRNLPELQKPGDWNRNADRPKKKPCGVVSSPLRFRRRQISVLPFNPQFLAIPDTRVLLSVVKFFFSNDEQRTTIYGFTGPRPPAGRSESPPPPPVKAGSSVP